MWEICRERGEFTAARDEYDASVRAYKRAIRLKPDFLPAYEKTGKWWHKDEEIDIVALNEGKNEIF